MSAEDEVYALPLDGRLGSALRLALLYGEAQIEAFSRGEVEGDVLVIDVNGEEHFCDVCGQLFPEPVGSLEVPFGLSEDDPRTVRVVLGICEVCKAELVSGAQVVES